MNQQQTGRTPDSQHHRKARLHLQLSKRLNPVTTLSSARSVKSITKQLHHYVSIKANTTAGNAPVTSASP